MTDNVYTISELDLGSCSYTKPEKFKGFAESFIIMNGIKGFILQTPKLILRDSSESSLDMLISQNKDRHREFYHILTHLEDLAIVQMAQNSEEWFGGNKIPRNQIELMFKSSIHRPLDIEDPFVFKVSKISSVGNVENNFPVTCLIKIDGIIFGKNSSFLDMKVVQIPQNKPEKIPSVPTSSNEQPIQHVQKPFFSDNVSIAPSSYTNLNAGTTSTNVPDKVEELNENIGETNEMEESKATVEEMIADEKLIELERPKAPPSPSKSVARSVTKSIAPSVIDTPPVVSVKKSIESLKCEIMKAMVEDNLDKVQELSLELKSFDIKKE